MSGDVRAEVAADVLLPGHRLLPRLIDSAGLERDGLDPAFAPGVSHPVPGGLTSRQVLTFVQSGHWNLVGMDVVETNPAVDVNNQTAILAGRLLHEGMGYHAMRLDNSPA